jgi:ADP-sugar diphosphatase
MSESQIEFTEPETLRRSPKYRVWKTNVERSGCTIRKIEILQELNKPDGSLLFALLRTRVEDPEGRPLPAIALLRGCACLIVTVIENSETGVCKFLMLRQRRIGHGGESLEFPAGMLDLDVEDPVGVAVREMKEETGLDVTRQDIYPLCDRPLYTSCGLDDEAIYYYACKVKLSQEQIMSLEGRETGQFDEHEYIRLSLWDYADALQAVDSLQVRLALSLYNEYQTKNGNGPRA